MEEKHTFINTPNNSTFTEMNVFGFVKGELTLCLFTDYLLSVEVKIPA